MTRTIGARVALGALATALASAGVWSCSGGSTKDSPAAATGPDGGGATSSSGTGGTSGADAAGGSSGSGGSGSGGSGSGSGSGAISGGSGSGATSSADGSTAVVVDSGASSGSDGNTGSDGGVGAGSIVAFSSDRVILTGVRALTTPAVTQVIRLHNGGQTAVQVTGLALSGTDQALFQINSPPTLPAMLAAGADLTVTVQLMTAGATLPAAPTNKDLGSTLLQASLTATLSSGSVAASVYGLVLIQSNWEPTLGQILTTLGYKLNVGMAQNNWNPNTSMNATTLPGIETGTDEVAAPHFVKVGTGSVTMTVVARFSPYGVLPYGWYPKGSSTTHTVVGTMSMITDPQTNDMARMVYPPLAAGSSTTFDPGTGPFGIWVYSDQASLKYQPGGNPVNGDYDYTEDTLNAPANVHRIKTYPLKDATGAAIAQSYLVAVEEAANGDYQDYVFVLGNVNAAP